MALITNIKAAHFIKVAPGRIVMASVNGTRGFFLRASTSGNEPDQLLVSLPNHPTLDVRIYNSMQMDEPTVLDVTNEIGISLPTSPSEYIFNADDPPLAANDLALSNLQTYLVAAQSIGGTDKVKICNIETGKITDDFPIPTYARTRNWTLRELLPHQRAKII